MTAAECIKFLDDMLAQYGETITIKRGADTVSCRASVRGLKADEFVGPGVQGDYMVVVSPTALGAFGQPQNADRAVVKGKARQVKFADTIFVDDVWVRTNLIAAG